LNAEGIEHVALVTTDENQAACRVYEGLGFGLAERWVQIDLEPVN
jgi:ribosomal protein S18 acetylase RimI-like enzyme